MMQRIEARVSLAALTLTIQTGLHIGTGYDAGLVQRTVMRDGKGNVYIPGSSLKGKTRDACEQVARLYLPPDLPACPAPTPTALATAHDAEQCLVCRLFGAPGQHYPNGNGLFWRPAYLTVSGANLSPQAWVSERTQVQLSRTRGIAVADHLYTTEFTAPGLTFSTRLNGYLELTPCSGEAGLYYELLLLVAGMQLLHTLGGNQSRGAGAMEVTLPESLTVTPRASDPQRIEISHLLQNVSLLEYYSLENKG